MMRFLFDRLIPMKAELDELKDFVRSLVEFDSEHYFGSSFDGNFVIGDEDGNVASGKDCYEAWQELLKINS